MCPNCDATGSVGQACTERTCRKRGYHYIPPNHAARASESEDSDPLIGKVIGDYLCVDIVGMGGFGKVYLAYQLPILMKAALKLMERTKFERGVMKLMLKQFEGEAAALAALNHPNIVRLLKYGTHNNTPYLVMEYVSQAVTLKREIANRAVRSQEFKPEDVFHVLTQIVSGLEAAHAMDIVHRDIKPDNVMLQELAGHPLFVRILDFGMAKFVEDQQDTKFAMGTPAYMAPEQLTRKGIGPWTDLYAVGVMAFELISGRRPFIGRTHQELLTKKIDPSYDPLTRISDLPLPDMARSFLSRALAFDPADRFRTASEFRSAMKQVFEELARSPSDTTMSVELSELVDSSHLENITIQREKLEVERAKLEEERAILERERQKFRRATASGLKPVSASDGPPRPLPPQDRPPAPPPKDGDTYPGISGDDDPKHLRAQIEAMEQAENWPAVIELKQRLLKSVTTPMEQFMLQMQIGDVHRTRLGYSQAAAAAYIKALKFGTFSKAPLLHLVQINVEGKNFAEAITYLQQLVKLEQAPKKKAVYAMSVGVLYRDALDDVVNSVKFLDIALDYDPAKVKAFTAIEEQLTAAKRWAPLAKCYERMILRVRKSGAKYDNAATVLSTLYKKLGRLLLGDLDEVKTATDAFEAAFKLRPRDEAVREQLLILYEEQGMLEKAAEQYRLRLKVHQTDFESYRALWRLYGELGDSDRAWIVAGLLVAFERANAEEAAFYETRCKPGRTGGPTMDEEIWGQLVVGPPEAPRLGQVFEIIFHTLGPHLETHSAKDFGLRRRDRVSMRGAFGNTVERVCALLGIPQPEFYLDNSMTGIQVLPIMPLALKVGPDVVAMTDASRLAFIVGKFVTLLHPWHVMGTLFDEEQLELLLLAARSVVSPEARLWLPPDLPAENHEAYADQVSFLRGEMDHNLEPLARVKLARLVPGLLDLPELPDIDAWRSLVEMTANHAGVVTCNDIALAAQVLRAESPDRSLLNVDEKLRDLVLWALSNRYLGVRRRLQLQVPESP